MRDHTISSMGRWFSGFAAAERYPTRTVEHMLAWMIFVWSFRVSLPGDMMSGPIFRYHLAIMPELAWGLTGMLLSSLRLAALIRNGHWKRSPALRLVGATFGFNFWLILIVLYAAAVANGAPDFPMRWVLLVLAFFELYSAYRCGQDIANVKRARLSRSESKPYG